ncbi:D-2-hydroxyacid dehydrogenase family protein [Alicyclobacillus fastidiosus]|uniref:D-2-hydroxyacid dehydrogenase family protein n=1 Tax=Alicyclobacillus fastidiosus TaxID=392011 RepID=A0ABV5AAZ8_9BACL|nr:D-2-hydroxyacid dehydrogenase family protein [Alicyclobacillus fastidiosus]WEH10577.1 D-2-hydroxyacid dehydrogenase family protein [Alicyclobacillus fastidiosus]
MDGVISDKKEVFLKMRCAVLDDYQNIALSMADWSSITNNVEVRVFNQHFSSEEDLINAVIDCEIIVAMRERTPFHDALFARLPALKLLVTTGMRNASIDLAAAAQHDVIVCGTGGVSHSRATVELTWTLILSISRNITQEVRSIQTNGPWQTTIGTDIYGKRLGVIGLGKIGSDVARIGKAFGMDVTAWSQNLTEERAEAAGATLASSKEELLEKSDFVSIHLVLSDRTKGLIGRPELQRMKKSAYLINTSRAPIVDQVALKDALQNHWIAGAGLDVFETEPLPDNDSFRVLPNVFATPHIGYVTHDTYRVWYSEAVEDIQAYLSGTPIRVIS